MHENTDTEPVTRLPRHRHSAAALNKLGDEAVRSSLEELERRVRSRDSQELMRLIIENKDDITDFLPDTTQEDAFVESLGLDIPNETPKIFVDQKHYREHHGATGGYNGTVAHFGPKNEKILVMRAEKDAPEFEKDIQKVNYVHELAHASSYWGFFPRIKDGGVDYPSARIGFHTGKVEKGEITANNGVSLEEAFANYIQGKYIKERGILFREFSPNGVHNDDFQAIEIEGVMTAVAHPRSPFMDLGLAEKVHLLAAQETIVFYPWYVLQANDPNEMAYNFPLTLGMALELLIENDPGLAGVLIESRKNASGLRAVRNNLEALQPGLYKEVRDLPYDTRGITSFYFAVVKALDKKYTND